MSHIESGEIFRIRLTRLMAARRLDCHAVGAKCSVHKDTVYKWRRGKTYPRLPQIAPLARALGCSADYLLGLRDSSA